VFLWGAPGCGRTHLLKASVAAALEAARPALYLPAEEVTVALPETSGLLLAIDDVEHLSPTAQIALFNAYNRAPALGQTLLLAGHCAPLKLHLREDLRTRIGQCLIFETRPLDDATRSEILCSIARRRGLHLNDEVVAFLLRHGSRELPRLLAVLDALDRASLERKRPATLPLLRELMQAGLDI
jgi:DnaA family protein